MDGSGPHAGRAQAYFSVSSMFRDHVRDLPEWIEFHRLVGAERFFLYNNASSEDWQTALGPYLDSGIVTVHDWPLSPGLTEAIDHCIEHHRHDSHWISFIDVDEFLFAPDGASVPDVLRDFEQSPGVGVNRYPFGTSGHLTRPEGLVIENYVRRAAVLNNVIKSIVHPPAVVRSQGVHCFVYEDGLMAVDELHRPLDPARMIGPNRRSGSAFTQTFTAERLRVNHYITKSFEEYDAKMSLPRPDTGGNRENPALDWQVVRMHAVRDETILRYVPQLKAALEGVSRG